ncbi:DUF928 domain-containing protein [Leptolyngbya cf. ectocarpi LEGE 11479]|uniref:DUF928 domain-containing protein n=1 Tax=Leptolyngbya cf. ectocarpi LEGE 11479 TaxID=1828722 RepID=A0A929FCF1_LEPEC|nr:DUF928 domain-containing protein [Leptolyngbya ectocarpi]MBE9069997.1 DUF928 domain-containing protein [Leptolyngbya cf. ectocarpi LEGE 11479]
MDDVCRSRYTVVYPASACLRLKAVPVMNYGVLTNVVGLLPIVLGIWLAALPALAVTFIPPEDNTAPGHSVGGASRRGLQFIPPPDNASPQQTASGASRIGFTPPPENSAPGYTASGASRDADFIPPPDNSTPLRTASGASRSPGAVTARAETAGAEADISVLSEHTPAMLAVTPPSYYGLTVLARPTMMAYLPKTSAQAAIFSLKDEAQSVIYQQVVPLDGAGGILAISLPEQGPALAIGEYYHWYVTLQTDTYLTPGSPYVEAWIKRVEPTAAMAEAMDNPDRQVTAEVMAQSGIWYDAAEQLATVQSEPQIYGDTAASWSEFLTSVGLESLVQRSFLGTIQ